MEEESADTAPAVLAAVALPGEVLLVVLAWDAVWAETEATYDRVTRAPEVLAIMYVPPA